MVTKRKKVCVYVLVVAFLLSVCACGNQEVGNTEKSQSETEIEKKIEIIDATDILSTVWETYEVVDTDGNMYNDRFDLMGGHFESAVMNMPAKYDLSKTNDLELMYCMPASVIPMIDDAGTMVHLMKASTFTAGSYHVTEASDVETVIDAIKNQILSNHWLDGFPDKYLIVVIDEQYIVSAIGTEEVLENFEDTLQALYGKQVSIQVDENIR